MTDRERQKAADVQPPAGVPPATPPIDLLAEIRRLQALDRPAQTSTDDLRDAALELLAAFSITSQDARERAIRRMCEVLKAARREGQL